VPRRPETGRLRAGLIAYGLDRPITGIGRYTVELARALAALEGGPELTLLAAAGAGPLDGAPGPARAGLPGCRLLPGLLTLGNAFIPAQARRLGLDVVHDPTGVTPFLFGAGGAAMVVTVHDVFPWSAPGFSSRLDTLIYRRWLPSVLTGGDQIVITVSRQSRQDIERYLHIPSRRISVIPYGVAPTFGPLPADAVRSHLEQRFSLRNPYVLYVGALTQRKNVERALQAFGQTAADLPELSFVLAGPRSWKGSAIEATVQSCGIAERVTLTGPLTDADLPALYNGARAFVFPSLYEGFGLPVLEAMACGTPVVTSNTSSLPEVAGDAALLVDPCDVDAIAAALRRVLTDPGLAEELRARGPARAAEFTWERTARETLAVYERAAASRAG
jgi:glycosyltransferase involved in cell wall biosynthesis